MNGSGHWQQPGGARSQQPGGQQPPPTAQWQPGGQQPPPTAQWKQGAQWQQGGQWQQPSGEWQQYGGQYQGDQYQGGQYGDQWYSQDERRQSMSTSLVVSLIALAAVALVAVGALVYFVVIAPSDGQQQAADGTPPPVETVWQTETATAADDGRSGSEDDRSTPTSRPQAPAGASVCSDNGNDRHGRAATGTGVTSCEFANAVRDAYLGSGVRGTGTINAYSPVTGQSYAMNCVGDEVVTCRGGNNAVVHIY